jgi:hypothetical protein
LFSSLSSGFCGLNLVILLRLRLVSFIGCSILIAALAVSISQAVGLEFRPVLLSWAFLTGFRMALSFLLWVVVISGARI